MILNAVIIDDESAARSYLKSLIDEYIPTVKVIDTAPNAIAGIALLNNHKVDIIFLDIEMPGGSGFDLIEAINTANYKVVFTTAYEKFALDAFKVQADGYLLKPIDIDELEDLIEKFSLENNPVKSSSRVTFRTQESIEFVKPEDIIRVEGDGNYSTVYLINGEKLVITKNMKQMEDVLNQKFFVKTHKSHLANINHIIRFVKTEGGHFEMIDDSQVPVSRRKKEAILIQVERNSN